MRKAGFQRNIYDLLCYLPAGRWFVASIFGIALIVSLVFASKTIDEKSQTAPWITISVVNDLAVFDREASITAVESIVGGRLLVLAHHSTEDVFKKNLLQDNGYALTFASHHNGKVKLIFTLLGAIFGKLISSVIVVVGVLLLAYSKIDGRPLRVQLKSRSARIALAFYFLTCIAIANWPGVLEPVKVFLLGFASVIVTSDVYGYVASGVGSKRPKVFFTVGGLIAVAFLLSKNSLGISELSIVVLIMATALLVCELVTRVQFHQSEAKSSFAKSDWICAFYGGFVLFAWRDIIAQHYIQAQGRGELPLPVQILLVPTFWFAFIWIPVALYLLRSVVQTHRAKMASLNAYNEKLLKSIQERELQINLAHYDDLRRQEQEATEAERQIIYRDLHDGIGSRLVAAMYSLRSGKTTKAALENALLACLSDIKRIMNADELQDHRSVQDLFFDYCFTMDDLLSESGVTFEYKIPSDQDFYLIGKAGEVLIKMSQEIVTNALKHSPARSIFVELELNDEELNVFIQESSYDFEFTDSFGQAKKISSGAGLSNLKLRAFEIGAEFSYEQLSDERRSHINMKLIDHDSIYLPDRVFSTADRRRQFLITQIGELS